MTDPVHRAFLEGAAEDAAQINRASEVVRLVPLRNGPGPSEIYTGMFRDIEHLERTQDGTVRHSSDLIPFTVRFPPDYLVSVNPDLQARVVRIHTPILHPNIRGGHVCLGTDFAPGTRLKPLITHLHLIVSSRIFATDHPFDSEARQYYLDHADEIRRLRAAPLWRRPVALNVSVHRPASPDAGIREKRP